jgi:hypothetical protein
MAMIFPDSLSSHYHLLIGSDWQQSLEPNGQAQSSFGYAAFGKEIEYEINVNAADGSSATINIGNRHRLSFVDRSRFRPE